MKNWRISMPEWNRMQFLFVSITYLDQATSGQTITLNRIFKQTENLEKWISLKFVWRRFFKDISLFGSLLYLFHPVRPHCCSHCQKKEQHRVGSRLMFTRERKFYLANLLTVFPLSSKASLSPELWIIVKYFSEFSQVSSFPPYFCIPCLLLIKDDKNIK